jgi:hypothetical protein
METTLIVLVSFLAIIVLILLGVIAYFLYRFLELKKSNTNIEQSDSDNSLPAQQTVASSLAKFCIDHPELPAKGICSISNEVYCELCLAIEDDFKIARKHISLYFDFDWTTLFFLHNEDIGADKLNELMRVKKEIWNNEEIPMITQKQYKINIEDDKIEAFTLVKIREQDVDYLSKRFEFLN